MFLLDELFGSPCHWKPYSGRLLGRHLDDHRLDVDLQRGGVQHVDDAFAGP